MNRVWILMKIQLLSWFGVNRALHGGGRMGKRPALLLILGLVCLGYFVALSYLYSRLLAQAMLEVGGDLSAVPGLLMAAASLLMLVTGVYSSGKTLFQYRDYDQVMSMPVSVAAVAASRVLVMYLYELLMTALLLVPAAVVYGQFAAPPAPFYPVYLLCMLLVPALPLAVSTALGAIVTAVSARAKRFGTAVNIVLVMVFVVAVVLLSTSMGQANLSAGVLDVSLAVSAYYPPARIFIQAVCGLDGLSILAFLVCSGALLAAFILLLSTRYRQIASRVASAGGGSRRGHTAGALRQRSPLMALYRRELARYLSSTIYVTNTAVGLVLAIVACVALLASKQLAAQAALLGTMVDLGVLAPLALAMLVAMSCTTGSSISLEGNRLWQVKALPVPAGTILKSKIMVNLTLSVPACAVCGILLCISLKLQGIYAVLVFAVPVIAAVFSAIFGIYVNLKLPKLDWQNEAQAVKQSAAAMLSMFGPMLLILLMILGVAWAGSRGLLLLAVCAVALAALAVFLGLHLKKYGEIMILHL